MYIRREAEQALASLLKQYKVVLVTGPRQVGKSTMVNECLPDRFRRVTLDDPAMLSQAVADRSLFFADHPLPLVIDEVQYAPQLFSYIKFLVDQGPERGVAVLTGSQTYQLMRGVRESLAGRVAVLELPGLSLRETMGRIGRGPFIPGQSRLAAEDVPQRPDVWHAIWRGCLPELQDPAMDWGQYYANYERTYLERDVRDLINPRDETAFYRFLVSCAARTAQLLNYSSIANDIDVDVKTVKSWVSVLETSGIVRIMQPYFSNTVKRLSKTPKIFFTDTGLACHLLGWTNPEVLRKGAMAGELFETFAVSEVLKSFQSAGRSTRDVLFYRDARKREIDLVVREGRVLHPIEIKKSSTPDRNMLKNFAALEEIADAEVGDGAVLCMVDRPFSIADRVKAVPIWCI